LIIDNYVIHDSKITRHVLSEELGGKVVLHPLPPYCPDHNRIERVWLDLHANVTRNHRCRTIKALMSEVWSFIDAYNESGSNPSMRRAAEV
jgi:transposase